jgi:autoinducer 2-degrading protein
MLIVQVSIQVKAGQEEAFIAATRSNAQESVEEPGIARFDFLQSQEDPTRFQLVEVYRDAEAAALHKETAHYQLWRDTVADMMAVTRSSSKFTNLFPEDAGW